MMHGEVGAEQIKRVEFLADMATVVAHISVPLAAKETEPLIPRSPTCYFALAVDYFGARHPPTTWPCGSR
jgi:hypothetical protein